LGVGGCVADPQKQRVPRARWGQGPGASSRGVTGYGPGDECAWETRRFFHPIQWRVGPWGIPFYGRGSDRAVCNFARSPAKADSPLRSSTPPAGSPVRASCRPRGRRSPRQQAAQFPAPLITGRCAFRPRSQMVRRSGITHIQPSMRWYGASVPVTPREIPGPVPGYGLS
jgi:hypothetical protein